MTYCFKCKSCGIPMEANLPEFPMGCPHCGHTKGSVIRDYAAEGVNVGPAVGVIQRDLKASADRDLFLPTRKDFKKPSDPNGDRGVADWNARHEPQVKGGGKYRPK